MNQFNTLGLKAVIFDMDGLLFESEALYIKGWVAIGPTLGLPITEDAARATIAVAGKDMEAIFQAHYGPAFTLETAIPPLRQWLTDHITEYGLIIRPGARELLELLHTKGIPFAIGTSNTKDAADSFLEVTGLTEYFPHIVAGDMVDHIKPAPDIFLKAAAELGFRPEECLVLEDSPIGIKAAHTAGCLPVMVPNLIEPTAEALSLAWRVFSCLNEVSEALFS